MVLAYILVGGIVMAILLWLIFKDMAFLFEDAELHFQPPTEPISKEEYDRRKREESYVGPYDPLMGDKKPKE